MSINCFYTDENEVRMKTYLLVQQFKLFFLIKELHITSKCNYNKAENVQVMNYTVLLNVMKDSIKKVI